MYKLITLCGSDFWKICMRSFYWKVFATSHQFYWFAILILIQPINNAWIFTTTTNANFIQRNLTKLNFVGGKKFKHFLNSSLRMFDHLYQRFCWIFLIRSFENLNRFIKFILTKEKLDWIFSQCKCSNSFSGFKILMRKIGFYSFFLLQSLRDIFKNFADIQLVNHFSKVFCLQKFSSLICFRSVSLLSIFWPSKKNSHEKFMPTVCLFEITFELVNFIIICHKFKRNKWKNSQISTERIPRVWNYSWKLWYFNCCHRYDMCKSCEWKWDGRLNSN